MTHEKASQLVDWEKNPVRPALRKEKNFLFPPLCLLAGFSTGLSLFPLRI